MKVDTSRLKKGTSEVPPECQLLIDRLRSCNRSELLIELTKIDTWTFGKCELYHWIDILDIFDTILEEATEIKESNEWCLACDINFSKEDIHLLLLVLNFTTLLIEHSFSRHLYNSIEYLTRLLSSSNMEIVLGVLNLLYMFSKRSNFISRLNSSKKNSLLIRLNHIAESWGGKEYGFGLASCCRDDITLPPSASTFFYEYYNAEGTLECIEIPNLDKCNKHASELTKEICAQIGELDDDQKMHIFTRIRLSLSFDKYSSRLQFVQARLQALSVLVYSNSLQENIHTFLYPGFLEELVELLEMKDPHLMEIRAAALRTLTSIIHLDRNPHFPKKPGSRLGMIIDVTGASSYHGFLPTLVRTCIQNLTAVQNVPVMVATTAAVSAPSSGGDPVTPNDEALSQQQRQLQQLLLQNQSHGIESLNLEENPQKQQNSFPLTLATALFSFLYHLASYETGGEALVACGMMESLLRVINWPGYELEHITFVTRAVRVIDLITNIEMQSFQNHGGLNSFIGRLDMEVNFCRREQPFEIEPQPDTPGTSGGVNLRDVRDESIFVSDDTNMSTEDVHLPSTSSQSSSSYSSTAVKVSTPNLSNSQSFEQNSCNSTSSKASKNAKTCLPQRAALLKSMLNFLKKAIQDAAFSESIRHVMEGTLPSSLRHIISNAEYYGPSLFLLATDVVTVFLFQEPSLLSSLQDNGLTDVVLQALLKKDVPATREVLGSLPNVFSALCLNARGLQAFVKYNPFDRLFKVLLSPIYLMAMRRRRSSDPMGDTASNLGNAMDELMRHQPTLKPEATKAIIKLLEELVHLGTDPKYICWRATNKNETSPAPQSRQSNCTAGNDAGSSDEEEDDEEEASTSSHHNQREDSSSQDATTAGNQAENSEREPIPLIDYILNVMKFVDAILSNNSTDDHCREFVSHGGLKPLLSILALPNLPVDSPITASAQAVAAVCKSILNLAHEPMVLQEGLEQLAVVVDQLKPLQVHIESPGGSVLLRELANCPNIDAAFSNASYTPLLHGMSAVHGYIVMLVHICRTGQSEIRNLLLSKWGQDSRYGKNLLKNLVQLYTALVWESTLLLALCTDDIFPSECDFGKEDIEKLPSDSTEDTISNPSAGEANSSFIPGQSVMDLDPTDVFSPKDDLRVKKKLMASPGQLRFIKALLGASSRLGRALAELFGNLVKLCVGSPIRQRRGQNFPPTPAYTSSESKDIARVLSYILVDGFSYDKLIPSPIPKLKLTFLICSVGFTGPMLFDEKRYAFHLMLHKFVVEGGLEAFFEMFRWALTSGHSMSLEAALETQTFPDGTGEFLDAWLMLLEKMVNPKAILESPHVINTRGGRMKSEFNAVLYLVNIHRLAFEAVTQIWGMKPLPTYGVRMTESMMSILKHILKGEKIIKEKYKKRMAEVGENEKEGSGTTAARSMSPLVINQDHLKQLMDMGFSQEHVTEALMHTLSVEQATEYLLNHPPPPPPPPVIGEVSGSATAPKSGPSSSSTSMEIDGDEDQVNRAIMMSLGQPSTSNRPKPRKYILTNDPPISDAIFAQFSDTAVEKCLYLMDELPDTVNKGTELLAILYRRNPSAWKTNMLNTMVEELKRCMVTARRDLDHHNITVTDNVFFGDAANKFYVRLHVYSLFLDETYSDMRVPAVQTLKQYDCVKDLINCLLETERVVTRRRGCGGTPKWLAQLLVFLDLYEKVAIYTQRKCDMHKVTTRIWKWYDVASGKWNAYSVSNNKIINDAYWSGESSVRISCGRQRYAINFNCMSQVNEETGNHRPVILALKATESNADENMPISLLVSDESDAEDNEDTEPGGASKKSRPSKEAKLQAKLQGEKKKTELDFSTKLTGLDEFDTGEIVGTLVRLMAPHVSIDRDTLQSLMKLCVRLTKSFENAEIFAREGGVRLLLNMRQTCGYIGFPTLSILLIRHVLEEPKTLALAMEKVIAARTIQTIPPGYRDLVFLLRQMSSAVSRDPKVFREVAQAMLRIDISVLRRNPVNEDNRLLLRSVPNAKRNETMDEPVSIQVVHDLLNALIEPDTKGSPQQTPTHDKAKEKDQEKPDKSSRSHGQTPEAAVFASTGITTRSRARAAAQAAQAQSQTPPFIGTPSTSGGTSSSCTAENSSEVAGGTGNLEKSNCKEDVCCGWHIPCPSHEHEKPLLPRATILKFLADAVRSYQTFAPLITEHIYKPGDSPLIVENTTTLSFILDKLLPVTEQHGDREVSTMSRILIAALASCSEQASVQYTVVSEVKAAINRALALPESADKHSQLQILAGLIPTMIENCPPDNNALLKLHHLQPRRNDIFYIMVRKGLITDLAKLTQYLDLSSPNTIATVNAALKPLETLLRMTNQPGPVPLSTKSKKPPTSRRGTSTADDTHARSASEATNTQDDPLADDEDNIGQATDGTQVNLDDIMDHLLERASNMENERTANQCGGIVEVRDVEDFNPEDVVLETSSESGDSDSNGTDNEEREMDEDDENEEEGEDRSEIDVDEETRQFIEIYDHVYGRHLSPNIGNTDGPDHESGSGREGREVGTSGGSPGRVMLTVNFPNIYDPLRALNLTEAARDRLASSIIVRGEATVSDASVDASAPGGGSSLRRIPTNIDSSGPSGNSASGSTGASPSISTHRHHLHHHHHAHTTRSISSNLPSLSLGGNPAGSSGGGVGQSGGGGGPNQQGNAITGSANVGTSGGGTSSAVSGGGAHHHHQQSSSSIGQRLVAVTRTFRTQLGNSATDNTNVRQRRYQLLNLNSRNTPVILQRLLGPGSVGATGNSTNVQDSSDGNVQSNGGGGSGSSNAFRDATRVVLMDNAFGIFSNTDEGSIDLVDQAGYLFGRSLAATLSSTPTALHWWLEEAKALGLESQSDICLTVANSLIPELVIQKALELVKIRSKKKKRQAEDENKAASDPKGASVEHKEDNKDAPSGQGQESVTGSETSQAMETCEHLDQTSSDNARNYVIGMDTGESSADAALQTQNTENGHAAATATAPAAAAAASTNQTRNTNNSINSSSTTAGAAPTPAAAPEHDSRDIDNYEDSSDLEGTALLTITTAGGGQIIQSRINPVDGTIQNRSIPTASEAMSANSTSDFISDTEHETDFGRQSPRTQFLSLVLPLEDENEDNDDDDDEEDDDEEEDDDDEDVGNNSSEQESSDVGEEEVIFSVTTGGSGILVNNMVADSSIVGIDTPPTHPGNRVQTQQQQQQQRSSQTATQTSATNEGPDRVERALHEATGDPITISDEEMASAVLIPLPDDDEGDFDDILEILDNTTSISGADSILDVDNAEQRPRNGGNMEESPTSAQNRTNENQEEGAVGGSVGTQTTGSRHIQQHQAQPTSIQPTQQQLQPVSHSSGSQTIDESVRSALGDLEVPEGVDPSFLAALPQEMREEVIAEHLRLQRIRQRAQQNAIQVEHAAVVEVNPEFLAALPPHIQEEVLAQQRLEQQRQAAATANPNDPVDAAAFFQNLQPSLRQAILTDMEDSQISVLPPDLAAEAQNLRRDWENRNRQMMQERLLNQIGSSTSNMPSVRYLYRRPRFQGHNIMRPRWTNFSINGNLGEANNPSLMTLMERQGRPILDHEALSCLLILLFVDEPKFNTLRLHRVVRNLCCHVPTREWIIESLLSIIERSNYKLNSSSIGTPSTIATRPNWLNIRLDAALGSRANVFVIKRGISLAGGDSGNGSIAATISSTENSYVVSIHPQASQIVCKHTLDLLITLAKSFPKNFLPYKRQLQDDLETDKSKKLNTTGSSSCNTTTSVSIEETPRPGPSTSTLFSPSSASQCTDFWDIIVRLDCTAPHRKINSPTTTSTPGIGGGGGNGGVGVGVAGMSSSNGARPQTTTSSTGGTQAQMLPSNRNILTFDESPFGKLIQMLSFDIVKRSCQLTDKLLRLLSFISVGLPDEKLPSNDNITYDLPNAINDGLLPSSEDQLRLAIEVLTSKSCSEEGLEDATSLLLNMSQCCHQTRTVILNLLIRGAKDLAKMVQSQIQDLMVELKELNRRNQVLSSAPSSGEVSPDECNPGPSQMQYSNSGAQSGSGASTAGLSTGGKSKGILQDRFTKETVIITAPNKVKQTCDLQLSSMVPLISKTSSQAFFLRVLKVIIQIREAVREAHAKAEDKSRIILGPNELALLSETLSLDYLWDTLSECLLELEHTNDNHAVLVLQPAVEAFFLVHASQQTKSRQPQSEDASNQQQQQQQQQSQQQQSRPNENETSQGVSSDSASASEVIAPISPIFQLPIDATAPETSSQTSSSNTASTPQPSSGSDEPKPMQQDEEDSSSLGGNSSPQAGGTPAKDILNSDQKKFLQFAEKHRTVLNQILRQSTSHLSDGPFAVLVDHTRILDFDVKRRYFRTELERLDEGIRREELAVHVHRVTVFEDSFRELYRRNPEEWKNRFYIVFEDEEGQDAGGLLREWYVIISREIFNPMYALFTVSPGDRVTYMINPSSHANPNHLCYYKFVGRVIAKAIYDNKLLECYFTRSFYKHILGIQVKYTDMESEDYDFYKGLVFLLENQITALGYELTFSLEVQEFGVTEIRDLIPNGRNIPVTEENKLEYIHLVCQLKMSGSIRQQLNAFLEGFYDIIPKRLISIFNEQELELLISGLPNVDIEDLKANTEYHKYQANSIQIQWFWRALRSFDQADRAKFLQFVTGTSKVPLQGFAALEGMNGTQKFQIHRDDRSTDRLPSAHTCFNQLDLPVYKTYDKLRSSLLKAIHECSEGFGFA